MNKKFIAIIILLMIGIVVYSQQEVGRREDSELKNDFIISDGYAQLKDEDLEIVEWLYSAKDPSNPDKNNSNFMGEVTNNIKDNMSKKSVNINLREGQSLKIETNIDYPITVMLKDNSNEEYIFNKTLVPVEGNILLDSVKKDGQYELTIDFNEIDEFKFKVYIY